jgi:hypothetical protein
MKLFRHCLLVTFGLTLAAGCSSAAGTTTPSSHPRPHPKAVTKTVTDRDKGTTVTVSVGDRVEVVLASTYWTIQPASTPAVLRSDGRQVTTPRLNGCVPGAGCGTARRAFTAVVKGTTTVSASRTTCGEALSCSGGNGKFSVTLAVR